MLDDESSLRLNLLRFPLIVGVVFIHAYSNTVGFAGGDMVVSQTNFVVDFVRNFVSQGVARIAVPLFFLMSGYLFFMGFEWSKESYLIKLQSRIKTLLIPFLFWNIATLLLTAIIQAMPATKMFLSGRSLLVTNYSIFDYLNAIIGLNTLPISYQFWFIRNLIILILLVPIINLINKTLPIPFLGILLCCWLTGFWTIDILLLEGLLFFSIGAYLGSRKKSLFSLDNFGVIIVSLYLIIAIIDALTINQVFNPYLHKISIMLGISSALFSTKLIAKNETLKSLIIKLSGVSFFVYAAHEPLLTILKKILYRILSLDSSFDSSFTTLLLYFFILIITIICTIVAYVALTRVAPKFVSIITGGR